MTTRGSHVPIAIVGMGCNFPGGASTPSKLWDLIVQRQSARSCIPPTRMDVSGFYHPDPGRSGTFNIRHAHFLSRDISAFDAAFFSISPAEAAGMDPQQRLLLETAYEAFESAGMPLERLAGSNTSCYVGCFGRDYYQLQAQDPETLPSYMATGNSASILANRVSYAFDLRGSSVTVDTACSSSLVALHLACQDLRAGGCDAAIVGGTNLIFSPDVLVTMSNVHFLGKDGTSYTFDARANGYARGEGIAAVVVKRLEDAVRDGDTIRAVVRGSASNQDGRTQGGIMLPSKEAQELLIKTAYERAGCDPSSVGYFEAHGTGTAAGDPVEAGAIGGALGRHRGGHALPVGSVKTNIGHTEGTSGLAGVIKAVLALERGLIPPNIHFESGNPAIDFDAWQIRVPTEVAPWPTQGVRRASVNSFGFGGTNAHVILDDAYHYLTERGIQGAHSTISTPSCLRGTAICANGTNGIDGSGGQNENYGANGTHTTTSTTPSSHGRGQYRIFPFSAHDPVTLSALLSSYSSFLAAFRPQAASDLTGIPTTTFLRDLSYTLSQRRSHGSLPFKSFCIASSLSQLTTSLSATHTPICVTGDAPRLGFIFTGQGAQWHAMGRELFSYPVFSKSLQEADRHLTELGCRWSLLEELTRDKAESRVAEAELSQPMCTAVQLALTDLLSDWGAVPDRVVGHSSGEIAAAYAAGKLSFAAAIRVAYWRGVFSSQVMKKGGMLAVGMPEADALERLAEFGAGLGVACVNSPQSVTLSGDIEAVEEVERRLQQEGVFARRLRVDVAYHSGHMLQVADRYLESLAGLETSPSGTRQGACVMISSVNCTSTEDRELDAKYWVDNMVSPVRFADALRILCTGGKRSGATGAVDILVEIGPHAALAGPVKHVLSAANFGKAVSYFSTLTRDRDACQTALEAAASLWARGVPVNLEKADCTPPVPRPQLLVDLPPYPWNHTKRFWAESRLSASYRFRPTPRSDFLGVPVADWNHAEPRWRNFIKLSDQPWLRDHQVQGSIVYPATGFLCMAIEAAKQIVPPGDRAKVTGYTLSDVLITRALLVPQTESGIELTLSVRPHRVSNKASSTLWKEFSIFSCNSAGETHENCRGLLRVGFERPDIVDAGREAREVLLQTELDFSTAKACCRFRRTKAKIYHDLSRAGLNYGKTFRNLDDVWHGAGMAVSKVSVPDTRSSMPYEYEDEHVIHPATMDAFLQSLFPALLYHAGRKERLSVVPTFIKVLDVLSQTPRGPDKGFEVLSKAALSGQDEVSASIVARSAPGEAPVVKITGLICTSLPSDTADIPQEGAKKLCFDVLWEPDLDLMARPHLESHLLDLSNKVQVNPMEVGTLETVASFFYHQALTLVPQSSVTQTHLQKLYSHMQNRQSLIWSGTLPHQTADWASFSCPAVQSRIESVISRAEAASVDARFLIRVGRSLPQILTGEVDPLALMLQDNLLEEYYTHSTNLTTATAYLTRFLTLLSHKDPGLTYLEVGAGTGGTTTHALQALGGEHGTPRFRRYTYTDVSPAFFEKAQQRFAPWAARMEYRKLDIESSPASQGFDGEQFDIVMAFNVLHATSKVDTTLGHVRSLLKPGGRLLLLEVTKPLQHVFLPFGTLPGWWAAEEAERQEGPTLTEDQWRGALQRKGMRLAASLKNVQSEENYTGHFMVADAPALAEAGAGKSGLAAVIAGSGTQEPMEMVLRDELLKGAWTDVLVQPFSQLSEDDVAGRFCVVTAEMHEPLLSELTPRHLDVLKEIVKGATGMMWVTRGAFGSTSEPHMALMHGLARTIRAEHQGWALISFDFSPGGQLSAQDRAGMLLRVLETAASGLAGDHEFSEQNGTVHVKRCIEAPDLNTRIAAATRTSEAEAVEMQPFYQRERALKLDIAKPGLLDTLWFIDDPAASVPLAPDHVKINVRAVGLNFHDIMICMGKLADDYLGAECSGVVSEVGLAVTHLRVGDRVCTWEWTSGTYRDTIQVPASVVQTIPDDMGFVEAASLPVVYCTAYYALIDQARLREGETVLVHAAAGGVGQAAIVLCRHYGAEVFATVGTEEKKQHIMTLYGIPEDHIFSSRSPTFADGIRRLTKGKGVDVVLNCLSGDLLEAGWSVLAPFGRFLEIGRRDIDENTRIGMAPFSKNATFTSVNLTRIFQERVDLGARLMASVTDLVRQGVLTVVAPITTFSFAEVEDAFRYMQAGKHMGKIVLVPGRDDIVPVVPRAAPSPNLHPQASYLIAGGFGGLGRSLARHLSSLGARHLIILSRSGASSPEALELVSDLASCGTMVHSLQCDISSPGSLQATLGPILAQLPPLRGLFQTAMVISDKIFLNMTHDVFTRVIRPKVQGSWNLHLATMGQPLDFFILLSSAAGMVGDSSQGNYAAGNAFQDALAHHRRAQGLPGVSIDLGIIRSVGYVAEGDGETERNLKRWGLVEIEEQEFLSIIDIAMAEKERSQIVTGVATQAHVDSGLRETPHWFKDAAFSHLQNMTGAKADVRSTAEDSLARKLGRAQTLEEVERLVLGVLVKKLARLLMIPADEIDATKPIAKYGIDSLVAVELRNWIAREVKADVPIFEILQAGELRGLGNKVARRSALVGENIK